MQRIYAGVFGSGLGHVTRVYSIADALRAQFGAQFLYSTFDEALDFLIRHGERVVRAPSVGVKWSMGGFSAHQTIVRLPIHMLSFSNQIAFEGDQISKYNPKVVISDSRLSTVFAAKVNRYPTVTILNQFKILFPPRFRQNWSSLVYERAGGDFLGLLWSLSNYVLFPDLPPPYTIGEANVAETDVSGKIRFTGFMSPKLRWNGEESLQSVRRLLQLDSRPLIFIQISGPEPTKPSFIETALRSAKMLSKEYNVVVSKGNPNGSSEPRRVSGGAWVFEWCPVKDELFLLSDLVVARSGHTTISQCIENAKQAVLIPIFNHSEQIWNAEKFVMLGQGIGIRSEQLTTERLVSAVKGCMGDSRYKVNALKLKKISDKYDGVQTATEFIREFF